MPDTDILSYNRLRQKDLELCNVCFMSARGAVSPFSPSLPKDVVRILSQAEMFHRVSEGLGSTGVFQMPLLGPKGLEAVRERSLWKFL